MSIVTLHHCDSDFSFRFQVSSPPTQRNYTFYWENAYTVGHCTWTQYICICVKSAWFTAAVFQVANYYFSHSLLTTYCHKNANPKGNQRFLWFPLHRNLECFLPIESCCKETAYHGLTELNQWPTVGTYTFYDSSLPSLVVIGYCFGTFMATFDLCPSKPACICIIYKISCQIRPSSRSVV